jgi:hypothetical protein
MIYALNMFMLLLCCCNSLGFHSQTFFQMSPLMREGFESIKAINHTECDCVYKDQAAVPRTTRGPNTWPLPTSTKAPSCKCPSFFFAEVEDDGVCGCVCNNGADCKQRHEGKEGFTMSDRRFVGT